MDPLITLGGIDLPDLLFENRDGMSTTRAAVAMSLADTPIIFEEAGTTLGRSADLVGGDDTGWLTLAELSTLLAMANVPGAVYDMTYHDLEIKVRFRNEEQPVIENTPVIGIVDQAETDYFNNIRIKLMRMD